MTLAAQRRHTLRQADAPATVYFQIGREMASCHYYYLSSYTVEASAGVIKRTAETLESEKETPKEANKQTVRKNKGEGGKKDRQTDRYHFTD